MCTLCDNATPATVLDELVKRNIDQENRIQYLENIVQQLRGSVQILSPGRSR